MEIKEQNDRACKYHETLKHDYMYCHIYIVAKHSTFQEMLSVWSILLTASHMISLTVKDE